MLIYNTTRYIPTDINMMVLQDQMGNYFYVHRLLYDRAVILEDRFKGNIEDLSKVIAGPNKSSTRPDVSIFFEKTPRPLNMLAPFLLLCDQTFTEFADMVGAIHVMSGPLDFVKLISVPYEVRNNSMSFSLNIKDEYQLAWDRFIKTCIEYKEEMFLPQNIPMLGTVSAPTNVAPTAVTTEAQTVVEESEQETEQAPSNIPDGMTWEPGLPEGVFIPSYAVRIDGNISWATGTTRHVLDADGNYKEFEVPDPMALFGNLNNDEDDEDEDDNDSTSDDTEDVSDTDEDDEEDMADKLKQLEEQEGLEGLSALENIM